MFYPGALKYPARARSAGAGAGAARAGAAAAARTAGEAADEGVDLSFALQEKASTLFLAAGSPFLVAAPENASR